MLISMSQIIYLPFYMELLKKCTENAKQMPQSTEIAQQASVLKECCRVHGKQQKSVQQGWIY